MHLQIADTTKSVMRLVSTNEQIHTQTYDFNAILVLFFGASLMTLLVISVVHKYIILVDKYVNLKWR